MRIAIFRECLLGYSETFIYSQSLHFSQSYAKFFGIYFLANEVLKRIDAFILNKSSLLGKFREVIYKLSGFSPLLKKKLLHFDPDLIHVHYGTDAARAIYLLEKLNKPVIVTFHGYDSNTSDKWKKEAGALLFKMYLKRREKLIKCVDKFIAVSEFVKLKLIEQGYDKDRIEVCPIGIDTDMFMNDLSTSRNGNVLFVGRMCENKGLNYLIDAMSVVQTRLPEVELTIVGDGELLEEMKLYARHKLNKFSFLGAVKHQKVKELMSTASVFCVPSIEIEGGESEAFGLVFAEAQALGTPVASFSTGGIPEVVIHNKTGLLCTPRDSNKLAENIFVLLTDSLLWRQFSISGVNYIRSHFDIKRTTQALELVYDSTIKSFNSKRKT